MNWNIYDVNEKIDYILDKYMDVSTGELSPEAVEEIEKLGLQRSDLITNLALAVKRNMMYISGLKAEGLRIVARIKSAERSSNWLLAQVKNNITEGETIKEEQFELKWSTSTVLNIDEFERIPEIDYKVKGMKKFVNKKVVTTYTYDKSALSAFIKSKDKDGNFNVIRGVNISKTKNVKIK